MDTNLLKRSISFIFMAERWGLKQFVFLSCLFIYFGAEKFWLFIIFFILYILLYFFSFDYLSSFDKKFFAVISIIVLCLGLRAFFFRNQALTILNNTDQKVYLELERKEEILKSQNGNVLTLFQTNKKQNIAIWLNSEQKELKKIAGNFIIEFPDKQRNPGGFDEAAFLKQYNCFAKINFIKNKNEYNQDFKIIKRAHSIFDKTYFYQQFHDFLETTFSTRATNFLLSLGFGQKQYLSTETKKDFKNLGLQHILAVSGFHFGLFLFPIAHLAKIDKQKPLNRLFLTLPFILIFLWLTDAPIGLLRTTFIYVFEIIFLKNGWYVSKQSLLLIVFGLFLLFDPLILFRVGFQLSFFAALIIYQMIPWLNKSSLLIKYPKLKSIALSAIIQISLLPFLILHFNQWQISNIILNSLLYFPLLFSFLIAYFSFILFLINIFVPIPFIIKILKLCNWLIDGFLASLEFIANSSIANYFVRNGYDISIIMLVFCLALFFAFILIYILRHLRGNRISIKIDRKRYIALVLSIFIFLNIWQIRQRTWEIYFLDVGQGDSCLIISPDKKSILIDAGNINKGYQVIMPAMDSLGIKKIDYAIFSHFDQDHIGGFIDLLEHRLIKQIYVPKVSSNNISEYSQNEITMQNQIMQLCEKQKLNYQIFDDQMNFIGLDIEIIYFSPKENLKQSNSNQESLCFKLKIEGLKLLFTGDIDETVEMQILYDLNSANQDDINHNLLEADILKVAHHGSKTSSSKDFIKKVKPQYAIISVGYNNYGHPNQKVLETLENENIKIRRTDINGAVMLKYKNREWQLKSYLE